MSIKSKRSVRQWTVWLVDHSKGGKHFQTVLKLRTTRWWRPIFEYLRNENDILQLIFPQIMTTFEHTDMYAKKNLSLYCTAQVSQTWKIPNIKKASKTCKLDDWFLYQTNTEQKWVDNGILEMKFASDPFS